MALHVRFGAPLAASLLLFIASSGQALAAPKDGHRHAQQIHPTGSEDTPAAQRRAASDEAKAADEELERMTNRSSEGLTEVLHPDGTVSMDLEGRFMNVATATSGFVLCETHAGDAAPSSAPPRPQPTRGMNGEVAPRAGLVTLPASPSVTGVPALEEK